MAQGGLPSAAQTMTVSHSTNNNDLRHQNSNSSTEDNVIRRRKMSSSSSNSPPGTPLRMTYNTTDDDNDPLQPRPNRARVNSREYAHSYEGAFADNDDMTGLEIYRSSGGWWENQQWFLFLAYMIVLGVVAVSVTMILSLAENESIATLSLTVTNILHFLVTLIYLHWLRGGTHDDQGDLAHLTLWEQIEGTPNTGGLRLALRLVPTVLCYMACLEAGFTNRPIQCFVNCVVWYLSLLGKMPWMNGVRIFGINAHITYQETLRRKLYEKKD